MGRRNNNLKTIFNDPTERRKVVVDAIISKNARNGKAITQEEAEKAYDEQDKNVPSPLFWYAALASEFTGKKSSSSSKAI